MANNQNSNNKRPRARDIGFYALILVVIIGTIFTLTSTNKTKELTYSEIITLFENEQVESFEVADDELTLHLREEYEGEDEYTRTLLSVDQFYLDLNDLITEQYESGVLTEYDYNEGFQIPWWLSFLPYLLMIGLFSVLWIVMLNRAGGGGSAMRFSKARAKVADEKQKKTFADVAGCDEEKEDLQEIVDFLKNPEAYTEMGARIPKGVLLVGPPGTGKTLMAKAVAGEAGVQFLSISGSDFVELYVGVGAGRVRDLFEQAKKSAPAIVFIDEIDAVGRQRGSGLGGGHDEREQTLNQLLVEMDGFDKNESVVLIAATNRSDILDPALLRPGRFDRQIVVDAPDVKGRERILAVHAKDKPLGSDVDLARVAKLTPGFTGADLMNLMNESALLAARRGKRLITMSEVNESMERAIAGPERKSRVMSPETQRIIAYHESGHALVGHSLPLADPVNKISIISRGRALGYTLSIPEEDKVLNSVGEMKDQLAMMLGGRVAEELFCGDFTTGASNDLERATKIARSMVTQYGMSPELGHMIFGQPNHEVFLGRDYGNTQDYSDETARRIDAEVARIMREAHDRAYEILSAKADQMHLMAKVLMEREVVDGEACDALLDNQWDAYLEREVEINAKKEAEEAAARAKDEELIRAAEAAGQSLTEATHVLPQTMNPQGEVRSNPYAVAPKSAPLELPSIEQPQDQEEKPQDPPQEH